MLPHQWYEYVGSCVLATLLLAPLLEYYLVRLRRRVRVRGRGRGRGRARARARGRARVKVRVSEHYLVSLLVLVQATARGLLVGVRVSVRARAS